MTLLALSAAACGQPVSAPENAADEAAVDAPDVMTDEESADEASALEGASDASADGQSDEAEDTEPRTEATDDDAVLFARLDERFVEDTTALVAIETWREPDGSNEEEVLANLARIQDYLNERVADWNEGLETLEIVPFEWKQEVDGEPRWVFGFRVGDGPRKFSMITHMDTVPPGDEDWRPFEARIEQAEYRGSMQDFLVGRGTIDDKGPGVLALSVLEAATARFDGTDELDDWTLEVSFDSAEETDMSTPFYIAQEGAPELGIVFDAYWCVVAEKGIERPVFRIPVGEDGEEGAARLVSLTTPVGGANQIADQAVARFELADPAGLEALAAELRQGYVDHAFDDPAYQRAPVELGVLDGGVVMTATVKGAQHGSAPYENREEGANPLVSLANFVAHLADEGEIAANGWTRMAQFMTWAWGTRVFGESHEQLLYRFDEVFTEGNGTTYALTRLQEDDGELSLIVDIRYALGHHAEPWDGTSQGQLPGESVFRETFTELLAQYAEVDPSAELSFETRTAASPDVRDPDSPEFQSVSQGFEDAMGYACPLIATGGGTDAKGHDTLVAAGALFSDDFGPPINFHGIYEGAPLGDLRDSAAVLYHILQREVASEE